MIINTDDFVVNRIDPGKDFPAEKTALILVDMMRKFCDPCWLANGDLGLENWFAAELSAIIPSLQKVLTAFRSAGSLVVHVHNAKWTHEAREVVPYQRGRDYDLFGSPAMSSEQSLAPHAGEIVIHKVASSAFTGTSLDFVLRNAGIRNVVLTGQYGNACVFYTLIQSRELGFSNYWLEDALLYSSAKYKALFPGLVGAHWAKLATADEIMSRLIPSPVEH